LLTRVLQSAPFPSHAAYVYPLRQILKKLERNEAALRILRLPVSKSTQHHIKELFKYIEDEIQPLAVNHHLKSEQARALFKYCLDGLADGSQLKNFRFNSRFPNTHTPMGSGRPLKPLNSHNIFEPPPTNFDSLEERNHNALSFGISIRNDIIKICELTFNQHDEILSIISNYRSTGLPKHLNPRIIESINNGKSPCHKALKNLSDDDLFKVTANLCKESSWSINHPDTYFPYIRLKALYPFCIKPSPYNIKEILLSEHFLPYRTLAACAICIMTFTGINAEVIKNSTLGNIQERGTKISLIGIKARSRQLIEGHFSSESPTPLDIDDKIIIKHPLAVKALRMLIKNTENIERISGKVGTSLLSAPIRKKRQACIRPIDLNSELHELWKYHGVNHISTNDLRRLSAHITFLSPGETIFSVQVLLGHENINTTIEYVNTNIIAQLLDANIRRFGEKLAATALFSTNRAGKLKAHGLTEKDVQPLLFPISKFSTEKCASDEWIDSSGSFPIKLGVAEIRHCAILYKYYQDNYISLLNENPRRFSLIHLPRIFFCIALRRIIYASQYLSVYQRFEESEK
jgi:hypothetical protein